ncbi:hypothetical protein E2C01_079674 [Portunus trituberculatus]|uniref:Uncharacterized protein n=1 Tax=Portunus trituberculatus TaxID=210409 RepID=A0A5B7IHI1_PORTR|nr:hypothetical protein [Portunus trituberculatus]
MNTCPAVHLRCVTDTPGSTFHAPPLLMYGDFLDPPLLTSPPSPSPHTHASPRHRMSFLFSVSPQRKAIFDPPFWQRAPFLALF